MPGIVVDAPRAGVLRIAIDRPRQANALDDNAVEAIHNVLSAADDDPECRVIVLYSANAYFCSGFDMTGYDGDPESRGGAASVVTQMDRLADLPLRMRTARQVVIAAVRGPAIGGGFALALGADVVIAGTSATFTLPQTHIGVLAAEMGISYLLPRIVGLNRAAQMMLFGTRLNAQGAVAAGLVCKVRPDDEVDEAALEMATELANRSAKALAGTKRMLLAGIQSGHFEQTIRAETQSQVLSNYWPEPRAAIASFRARGD